MVAPVVHQFQFNKNVNIALLVFVLPLSHFKPLTLNFVLKKQQKIPHIKVLSDALM